MKPRVFIALMLMGFTSLVAQALLIREFFITFYGNELTIGLILGCWIMAGAIGSGLASRFSNKMASPGLVYGLLQAAISIYLPISVLLIRNIKNFFIAVPGEAAGIGPIIGSCILVLAPLGILGGMQFPFGCRLYSQYKANSQQTAGRVYILEAIGFILAGGIFTYIFLTHLNSFQIAFAIGLINLVSALSLASWRRNLLADKQAIPSGDCFGASRLAMTTITSLRGARRPTKPACPAGRRQAGNLPVTIFFSLLIILNSFILFSGIPPKLQASSLKAQWRNQNLVEYSNSIYGNLAVSKKAEQYTFYSNGSPITNIPVPDIAQTEEFVHFGMLSHPNPRNVLFLSGGAGGPFNEVLKYPIERADYAELDPLLIKLLKKFPTAMTEKELNDRRVNLVLTDGCRFVKQAHSRYDVAFLNVPYPSTLQLNRYYTKEFFKQVEEILNPGGELVLGLPGSLSYLNEELKGLNLCILDTLKDVFKFVEVIPGYSNIYISSQSPFEISPQVFEARLKERNIETKTLDRFHLEDRLKKYWQDWFYGVLGNHNVKENKNLSPAGVFYGISYWNSLFNPGLRNFFNILNKLNFNYLIVCLVVFACTLFVIARSPAGATKPALPAGRQSPLAVAASIATTGFAGMSLNLLFVLSYQVFFGYVYRDIALLAASFMAGLVIGTWAVTKNLEKIKKGLKLFIAMEITIAIFSLVSGLLLVCLNAVRGFNSHILFYILICVTGFLVGAEFPLANKLYRQDKSYVERAGVLYAMDLFGAFFAALLVSIIFIPIFGVLKTCLFLAILKISGLLLYLQKQKNFPSS